MKTWMVWVILLVFIFVVVPLIYFAIVAKNVSKVVETGIAPSPVVGLTVVPGTGKAY